MKYLLAFAAMVAAVAVGAAPAVAQTSNTAKKAVAKKTPAKKAAPAAEPDDKEPDVAGLQPTPFDCELGNKLTIYTSANDDNQITLHWKKRLHHMTRVTTTTGAQRFEDQKQGLVWIGIPAKGMLLDSKKGQQLANECRSPAQMAANVAGKN